MVESAYVRGAKVNRLAAILADGADLKASSDHKVKVVRRAERDALDELAGSFEDAAAVQEVALPSDRLSE